MTALRLEGNTLGVGAAEAISKALAKHPEFEVSSVFTKIRLLYQYTSGE